MTQPLMDEGITWWVPVYYEPILGSGERLTVVVCLVNDWGAHIVEKVKDFMVLAHVIGLEEVNAMRNCVQQVFQVLETQLALTKNLATLDPRMDGVTMGTVRRIPHGDVALTIQVAIQQASFLCGVLTTPSTPSGVVGHA